MSSATQRYVLWGSHPRYAAATVIRLSGGNLRQCRSEQRSRESEGGWLLGIYAEGDAPEGLRLQATQRKEESSEGLARDA